MVQDNHFSILMSENFLKLMALTHEELCEKINTCEQMIEYIMNNKGYEIMECVEEIKYELRCAKFVNNIKCAEA